MTRPPCCRSDDLGHRVPRPRAGDNRPVRGIELEIGPGEVLGVVGETGCGKSITGLAVLGSLPDRGASDRPGALRRRRAARCPRSCAPACAATRSVIVFQNPGTAFNPVFRLGQQMRMVLAPAPRPARGEAAAELIAQRLDGRSCRHRTRGRRLPARALRRDAAARDDRDGPAVRAEAADPRRADDGARRHDRRGRSCC